VALSASAVATKWATNLGNAASDGSIQAGVTAVTVAPGQAAARQKTVWVANVTASANKWATNTAAVSLSSWQNDMVTKGLPRIATGATAATSKMTNFFNALLPQIASIQSSLPARGNFQQNLQRSTAFITAMHNWSYTASAS
jgi:hypothetical protein